MIPKVIHYCWFGGKPLPKLARKCIASWKRYMPGYEIRRWDESNFDTGISEFTRKAYSSGKYAFVSDYARFRILHEVGGIYLDTDVELLKPIDDIAGKGNFLARECDYYSQRALINVGLCIGYEKGSALCRAMLGFYNDVDPVKFFDEGQLITVIEPVSDYFYERGLRKEDIPVEIDGATIYPPEYFSPMDCITRRVIITPRTRAIHHYAASWQPGIERIKNRIKDLIGPRLSHMIIGDKTEAEKKG